MHANGETGTRQPIRQLADFGRARGALFHTDASQTVGKIPVSIADLGVDLLTVTGHKMYGPKGSAPSTSTPDSTWNPPADRRR